MVRIWQTIEVVAQDLTRQENRTDAKAALVNLRRNEVLISFVLFGLADVPDWHLVEITIGAGAAILDDQDLCANCISCRYGKSDVVTNSDMRCEKTGHQELGSIREHTDSGFLLPLDAHHTLAADGSGRRRNGGRRRHTFGGHYRVVLRKSKTLHGAFQCASCKISKSRHVSAIRDVLKNSYQQARYLSR